MPFHGSLTTAFSLLLLIICTGIICNPTDASSDTSTAVGLEQQQRQSPKTDKNGCLQVLRRKVVWQKLRNRGETNAGRICETIILRIPGLCFGIQMGFGHIFGPALVMWAKGVCDSYTGYGAMGFGARRRRRSLSPALGGVYPTISRGEMQQFVSDYATIGLLQDAGDLSSHVRRKRSFLGCFPKNISSQLNPKNSAWYENMKNSSLFQRFKNRYHTVKNMTTRGCLKVVKFMSRSCKQILGDSFSNHIRDFAWLCYFVDITGICASTVKSVGDICRATLDREERPEEEGTHDERFDSPPPPPPSVPMGPVATCRSLVPTAFGFCKYFRATANLLTSPFGPFPTGHLLARVFNIICDGWFDGLIHVVKIPKTITIDEADDDNDGKSTRKKRGLKSAATKFRNIIYKAEENVLAGINSLIVHASYLKCRAVNSVPPAFQKIYSVQKKLFKAVGDKISKKVLSWCDSVVRKMSPLCQKIFGDKAGKLWDHRSLCFWAGPLAGPCLVGMTGLSGICAADVRKCDESLVPTPASAIQDCKLQWDSEKFLADPAHACANYYFYCKNGKTHLRRCFKGSNYVFDPETKTCKNKVKVKQCQDVLSPCASKWANPDYKTLDSGELACDPSLEPPKFIRQDHKHWSNRKKRSANSVSGKSNYNNYVVNNNRNSFRTKRNTIVETKKGTADDDNDDEKDVVQVAIQRRTSFARCFKEAMISAIYGSDNGTEMIEIPQSDEDREIANSKNFDKYAEQELNITIGRQEPPFNCSGHPDLSLFPASDEPCETDFIRCDRGQAERMTCAVISHVFDANTSSCQPRSLFSECRIPSCPAGHFLRTTCRNVTTAKKINCDNRPDGIYGDPHVECTGHFFLCKDHKQKSGRQSCDVADDGIRYIFDERSGLCQPFSRVTQCHDYPPTCEEYYTAYPD